MVSLRTLPERILGSGLICKDDLKTATGLVFSHLMRTRSAAVCPSSSRFSTSLHDIATPGEPVSLKRLRRNLVKKITCPIDRQSNDMDEINILKNVKREVLYGKEDSGASQS